MREGRGLESWVLKAVWEDMSGVWGSGVTAEGGVGSVEKGGVMVNWTPT